VHLCEMRVVLTPHREQTEDRPKRKKRKACSMLAPSLLLAGGQTYRVFEMGPDRPDALNSPGLNPFRIASRPCRLVRQERQFAGLLRCGNSPQEQRHPLVQFLQQVSAPPAVNRHQQSRRRKRSVTDSFPTNCVATSSPVWIISRAIPMESRT